MRLAWHEKNPSLLSQLKLELATRYPDLTVIERAKLISLKGGFPVVHQGVELDRFQIQVFVPSDFPKNVPIVRELAGRVPLKAPDWHTFDGGALCVIVPEEWLIHPLSHSLIAFLDGPVRNFFIGHALAEAGLKRPMGERPHFGPGLLEAYGEMVGSKEPSIIQTRLTYLAKERFKGHWDCPCGSGKRLRNCHMIDMLELRKRIPSRVAKMALKRLHDHTKGRLGSISK